MKKFFFLLCFSFISVFAFSQWYWQNPLPQGNELDAIYFTDSNTGYAVGVPGTIIKTTDGGITWTISSGGNYTQLNSIFFTNNSTGYIAGNGRIGDLILKTTDAGSTWNTVLSGTGYGVNSIFFPTDDIGYGVGIFGEIVKTTDAGNTWTYQNSGTLANLTSVYFTDDITGYAVGYNGNENNIETILKTINGGTTWDTLVNPTNVPLNCVVFTDPNTGYIAGDGSLIKTTNAGITWTVDTNGMGYMYYQNDFITVFFIGQDTGYVADLGGDLLKTTNAGTSWHFQTVAQGQGCSSMYFINSNTGYMVGEAEISQTLNGGVTWNQLSFGTNRWQSIIFSFFS